MLGLSALLTTTMPYMKVVIDTLKEKGLRDDYIVLVGGAPLNEEFGKAVGEFSTSGVGLKALGQLRVHLVATSQRRNLDGVFGDKDRVPQRGLGGIFEELTQTTSRSPRGVHRNTASLEQLRQLFTGRVHRYLFANGVTRQLGHRATLPGGL